MDPTDFLNSKFATPEQVAQLRAYAQQLMANQAPSDIAPSWAGALAAGLRGAIGPMALNQANQLQRQLLSQGQQGLRQGAANNPYVQSLIGNPTQPQASNDGSGANVPRGIRNNNPGNIEYGQFAKAHGAIGDDGRFAIFPTMQHGQQAMDDLLSTYGKQGLNTPQAIINKWAPPSENNSSAYAATVASKLGISPTAALDMTDPNVRSQLGGAITAFENGPRYAPQMQARPQMAQSGDLSSFYMNPSIPKDIKDTVIKGTMPTPAEDVYGRPGYRQGVMGGAAPVPTAPGFEPGIRAPTSVGPAGDVSTTVPFPAGGQSPQGGLQQRIQPLVTMGQEFRQQSASVGGTADQIKSDTQQAYATIPIIQTLAQMKDTMQSHGDRMVWGPTADWVNNLKRSVAQHAPGFMSKSDLEGIAAADDFDKLSAQLQTLVGRQAGATDMSLLQGIKSVPGSHNSKEGAMALIDMLTQVVGLNGRFVAQNQSRIGQPGFDYLTAKNKFFEDNPIRNPLTGNPIRLDLGRKQQSPGETKVINGKTYMKINGIWHEGM